MLPGQGIPTEVRDLQGLAEFDAFGDFWNVWRQQGREEEQRLNVDLRVAPHTCTGPGEPNKVRPLKRRRGWALWPQASFQRQALRQVDRWAKQKSKGGHLPQASSKEERQGQVDDLLVAPQRCPEQIGMQSTSCPLTILNRKGAASQPWPHRQVAQLEALSLANISLRARKSFQKWHHLSGPSQTQDTMCQPQLWVGGAALPPWVQQKARHFWEPTPSLNPCMPGGLARPHFGPRGAFFPNPATRLLPCNSTGSVGPTDQVLAPEGEP